MLSRLRFWILAGIGAAWVATLAVLRIRTAQRDAANARLDRADGYIQTREAIDDAPHLGDDPAVARDWLRARDER